MSEKMLKVGLNGFGRIGRMIARINYARKNFELVAINDIQPVATEAYLLRYDTTYGRFPGKIENDEESITIDGRRIRYFNSRDIAAVPWADCGADIVIDASGVEENEVAARKLLGPGGVKRVIITHSTDKTDREIIMGVNDGDLRPEDRLISSSICDANAIAHILKWLDDRYGVEGGSVTTLHPWLGYQNISDGPTRGVPGTPGNDLAMGRAAVGALIPKRTTAVTAAVRVLPQLKEKLMSFSYRTPTDVVASADLMIKVADSATDIVPYIRERVRESKYVLGNEDACTSVDFKATEASAVLDLRWLASKGSLVKAVLWYDNEWGYSARAIDLAMLAGARS